MAARKRKYSRPCCIPGCPAWAFALGLCSKHYTRQRRHGDTSKVVVPRGGKGPFSSVCDCGARAISRGLCRICYNASYYAGGRTATHMPNGKDPTSQPDAIFLAAWPAGVHFSDDPQAAAPERELKLSRFAPPNPRAERVQDV